MKTYWQDVKKYEAQLEEGHIEPLIDFLKYLQETDRTLVQSPHFFAAICEASYDRNQLKWELLHKWAHKRAKEDEAKAAHHALTGE